MLPSLANKEQSTGGPGPPNWLLPMPYGENRKLYKHRCEHSYYCSHDFLKLRDSDAH